MEDGNSRNKGMSQNKITKLTPEQEALIPMYQDKWKKILLSTERVNQKVATESINKLYALNGFTEPEVIFFDSPFAALSENWLEEWLEPRGDISSCLTNQFHHQIDNSIYNLIWEKLYSDTLNFSIQTGIGIDLQTALESFDKNTAWEIQQYSNSFEPEYFLGYSCLFDFCISILKCDYS